MCARSRLGTKNGGSHRPPFLRFHCYLKMNGGTNSESTLLKTTVAGSELLFFRFAVVETCSIPSPTSERTDENRLRRSGLDVQRASRSCYKRSRGKEYAFSECGPYEGLSRAIV
jgi:hypothetical protein